MDINITLIGQMITFMVFVWFTMKFIWPPVMKAIRDRQAQISEGLAAAEKGKKELELAEHRAVKILQEAKLEASQLVEKANKRAGEIVEHAKTDAREEAKAIVEHGQKEVEQMQIAAKENLQNAVIALSIQGAHKILEREVDEKTHQAMLKNLAEQL